MKKFLISLIVIILSFCTMCVWATESEIDIDEEVLLENLQNTEDVYTSNEEYTDEEIEKMYQDMLEEMYEESLSENQQIYNEYEAEEPTKAKVIEVKETEYVYDTDYTNAYKYKIQNLMVKVLEGEYADMEMEATYQLSNDSLVNLEMPEARKGDIIYIDVYADEDGNQYAVSNMIATMVGASVERKIGVCILGILAFVLVCIFGKEKGILSILIAALMLVLTLLIYGEQIFLGTSILLLAIIISIVIVVMLCIQRIGLTKDAIWVSVISIILICISSGIAFLSDAILRSAGGTFDAMFLTEYVLNRNIDFHNMFIGSIVLILSGILPYIVCDIWKECKNSADKSLKQLLNVSKNSMSGKIEILTIILMVMLVPKIVYLYCSKYYTMNMILNSEILVTELIRFFVCLISISITIPITVFACKYFKNEENIEENK